MRWVSDMHAFLVCGSKKREFAGDSMFFFFNRGRLDPILAAEIGRVIFVFHFNQIPGGRRSLRVVWRAVGGTQWAPLEVDGWKMFFF